jgi:negative regulator of flagellin synthesis FlgM
MRIWGDVPKVSEVYGKHKNVGKTDKSSDVPSKKDVLSISNEAKDFQAIMKAVKEVPDIRTDKVNELKDKYESGNYNVNGKDIADKLLHSVTNKKS